MHNGFPPCGRLLVVSPHLDDAVFGCGMLMATRADVTVVTVFAGIPAAPGIATDWDGACGFGNALEAMQSRREEDRRALAMLGAHPVWMDFLDGQYEAAHSQSDLHAGLKAIIEELRPQGIFAPAGLFHRDHDIVHATMMALYARDAEERCWWLYEEPVYRRIPGLLQRRLSGLLADGHCTTPYDLSDAVAAKAKRFAIERYASQLAAFKRKSVTLDDLCGMERYWRLAEAPLQGEAR